MSIINKKIKTLLFSVVKQKGTGIENLEEKKVTHEEESLKNSELLLLQINSEENEFLFI